MKRISRLAAALLALSSATPSSAQNASLDALLAADRIVLVQFHAARCSSCPQQEDSLGRISRDRTSWVPAVVQLDLDRDGGLKDRFKVEIPGTLLLLQGKEELARAADLQSEEQIREFIGVWTSRTRGRPRARARREPKPKR